MKIIIRADGGKDIGMGHVMRMLVLASEIKKHNNEVIFLCKFDKNKTYKAGIDTIKENDFEVVEIDCRNTIEEIIEFQQHIKADLLITDSYDVNESYFNRIKTLFKYTGYVDDVNKLYMNVDFIINQNINALELDYSKTTNEGTKLFLGTQYCMIRDEFKKALSEKRRKEIVKDVLLTLGGMDEDNNTMKILELIKDFKVNIHVVLGKAFNKSLIEQVYKIVKKYSNIYPYENASMSELMKKCDIAISACGSTIYELCVMKIPTIGIVIAENQRDAAEILKKRNVIMGNIYAEELQNKKIVIMLDKLINDNDIRTKISDIAEKVVNVNGSSNLYKMISTLCNK